MSNNLSGFSTLNSIDTNQGNAYIYLCANQAQAVSSLSRLRGGDIWWVIYDTSLQVKSADISQETVLDLAKLGSQPILGHTPTFACDSKTLLAAVSTGYKKLYQKIVVEIKADGLEHPAISRMILSSLAGTRVALIGTTSDMKQDVCAYINNIPNISVNTNSFVFDFTQTCLFEPALAA